MTSLLNPIIALLINIRSFNANFDNFSTKLSSLDIDFTVFVLTETSFSAALVRNINEFVGHHSFRYAGGGGGVSLYVLCK